MNTNYNNEFAKGIKLAIFAFILLFACIYGVAEYAAQHVHHIHH